MKKAILFLTIGLTYISGYSQSTYFDLDSSSNIQPKYIHKLGLHAGTTSGLGLSYKLLINNHFMIQMATLPVASKYYKYINSGISLKYKFRDEEFWDFYAFGAGSHVHQYNNFSIWGGNEQTWSNNYNASSGIAVEYGKGEFFKLCAQIGYGLYNIGQEEWITNLSIGTTIDFSLNSK